jgi:SnoaL-like domain
MTTEALWMRYAAIWSLDAGRREAELAACLADDVTYCDPNGLLAGRSALSSYMEQFRASVPGGQFHIRTVLQHHDCSLADWELRREDGAVLQAGTSFGSLSDDGRLRAITGFFRLAPSASDQPQPS